jgi:hypothetical protein
MATTFEDVIDVALSSIQDYKLDKLYSDVATQEDFETITTAFLLRGIPEFYDCKTSLSYNTTTKSFDNTLTSLEISILADLWVYQWFAFQLQNLTQLQNKMTPKDFSHFSEAQNLQQKREYLDTIRERYSQKMMDYSLRNVSWSSYGDGDFGV